MNRSLNSVNSAKVYRDIDKLFIRNVNISHHYSRYYKNIIFDKLFNSLLNLETQIELAFLADKDNLKERLNLLYKSKTLFYNVNRLIRLSNQFKQMSDREIMEH